MELSVDSAARLVRPARREFGPGLRLAATLCALTAVRLLAAALVPLTEDESYYRLWAQHLAAGYYDHPPMIAWWIALGVRLAGDTPLGVRLLPVLACTAAAALAADAAGRFGADGRTRLRVVIWINSAPLVGVGGLLAVPDAPVSLFWAAAVRIMAEISLGGDRRLWPVLGGVLGLALLSKYSAAFLVVGVGAWTLLDPRARAGLRTPWPWLAAVVALAVFAPNLVWNARNDWITVVKQGGRAAPGALRPMHVVELLAGQLLLFNPVTALLLGRALLKARPPAPLVRVVACAAAPFAGYLLLHALHATVQAHWPAPLYAPLILLAALAPTDDAAGWRRLRGFAPLGLLVSGLALVRLAAPSGGLLPDPGGALRGWPAFARAVEASRKRAGAGWVATASYGLEAQLETTRAVHAPLLQLDERRRYRTLSISGAGLDATPGLVIDLPRRLARDDLAGCFQTVERLDSLDRGDPGGPATPYAAYRVSGPKVDLADRGCALGKDRRSRLDPD